MFQRERIEAEYTHLFKGEQPPEGPRLNLKENAVMQHLKEGLLCDEGRTEIEKVEKLKPIADKLNVFFHYSVAIKPEVE
ncbi:3703_t:CDS:2 [Entrophospora sp. SA101]|nr:3703_t:CDS:2 [Entrophospora sp. SA101]